MDELAQLEKSLRWHKDAEVINIDRLKTNSHKHTVGMCKVINTIIESFPKNKLRFLVEVEISSIGKSALPEDIVVWVEEIGLFVLEVKSHNIEGIRRFENNVPQVIYQGQPYADKDLLDQPRDFAYKLRGVLEPLFEDADLELPALYFAGWLPYVTPGEVASRNGEVAIDRVWLSDMLEREEFLARLPKMKNITRGKGAVRSGLDLCMSVFGCTSGLRNNYRPRPVIPHTLSQLIHERERQLKKLTIEQERLAFSPNLVKGPKVIRGVVGSGKTILMANAIAERFLREYSHSSQRQLFIEDNKIKILALCYNVALIDFIREKIQQCFDHRKPNGEWRLPTERLQIINIDQYASKLLKKMNIRYDVYNKEKMVDSLLELGVPDKQKYDHVFIDEGQDVELVWYPLIREVAKSTSDGLSIVVFYDEAQNVYGVKAPGSTPTLPKWEDLLGSVPHPRGLETVMRVGHRNTNEILTFSFNILLGAFADYDPEMAVFTNLNEYTKKTIPDDPSLNHPNAGKPCVEIVGKRQYQINFAVRRGPLPMVFRKTNREELLDEMIKTIRAQTNKSVANVDPRDILIMTPKKESLLEIISALDSAGIDWHCPNIFKFQNDPRVNAKSENDLKNWDPRKEPFFQEGCVTASTIKSAKGYTAHICHIVFIEDFPLNSESNNKEVEQRCRAELHVACTRATLSVNLWGCGGPLMQEAEDALADLRVQV
jgi:hypothetical protein